MTTNVWAAICGVLLVCGACSAPGRSPITVESMVVWIPESRNPLQTEICAHGSKVACILLLTENGNATFVQQLIDGQPSGPWLLKRPDGRIIGTGSYSGDSTWEVNIDDAYTCRVNARDGALLDRWRCTDAAGTIFDRRELLMRNYESGRCLLHNGNPDRRATAPQWHGDPACGIYPSGIR